MDVSNKTLAFILIVSIVVTIGVAFVSIGRLSVIQNMAITGFATDNETAAATGTLSITSTARLYFQRATCAFGSGYVNTTGGNLWCNLSSGGGTFSKKYCLGFTSGDNLRLRNDGNVKFTSVWLNSSHTAATFVGGSNPSLKIKATEESATTCTGTLNFSSMTEVSSAFTAHPGPKLCTEGFNYNQSEDDITILINISLPYNSLTGAKTVTLTATGEY
ncbi:MAG: hypothetical protein V1659_04305 [Candidatus Woesearchaeota archaeon]